MRRYTHEQLLLRGAVARDAGNGRVFYRALDAASLVELRRVFTKLESGRGDINERGLRWRLIKDEIAKREGANVQQTTAGS